MLGLIILWPMQPWACLLIGKVQFTHLRCPTHPLSEVGSIMQLHCAIHCSNVTHQPTYFSHSFPSTWLWAHTKPNLILMGMTSVQNHEWLLLSYNESIHTTCLSQKSKFTPWWVIALSACEPILSQSRTWFFSADMHSWMCVLFIFVSPYCCQTILFHQCWTFLQCWWASG